MVIQARRTILPIHVPIRSALDPIPLLSSPAATTAEWPSTVTYLLADEVSKHRIKVEYDQSESGKDLYEIVFLDSS